MSSPDRSRFSLETEDYFPYDDDSDNPRSRIRKDQYGKKVIPSDRYIDRYDLGSLAPIDVIDAFEKEFRTSIHCFSVVRPMIRDLFNSLDSGDVLLVPGDTPFKIVRTMIINHRIGHDRFRVDGVVKRIIVLDFPLSGVKDIHSDELNSYLLYQLTSNNISVNSNFVMYDYSSSGSAYEGLRRSLAWLRGIILPSPSSDLDPRFWQERYYRDPILSFVHMNLDGYKIAEIPELKHLAFGYYFSPTYQNASQEERRRNAQLISEHLSPCTEFYENAIIDAEVTGSRCVASRYLRSLHQLQKRYQDILSPEKIQSMYEDTKSRALEGSLYNCNLIIAMMALTESGVI